MEKIVDFLGTPIKIGVRGVRVHSSSHWKEFKKVTIKEIDTISEPGKIFIGVISDGNTRIGWTFPDRIIVQDSFKIIL